MPKLSEEQIKQKLAEGRNYKHLYHELKIKYDEVKAENKELRQLVALQQAQLEKQAIQIAELQTMVFGKKRKPPTGHYIPDLPKPEAQPRSKGSYRRPIPPAHAITAKESVPLPENCNCGGSFRSVTTHERYVEDIPLPELSEDYQSHLVTKYVIERGVCSSCGKAATGESWDLGGQNVTLGPNVRLLICHLVTIMGLSYAQKLSNSAKVCTSYISLMVR